eukprot:COSAG02_NODE_500_length_21069_cov_21.971865_12_plen_98_part_00
MVLAAATPPCLCYVDGEPSKEELRHESLRMVRLDDVWSLSHISATAVAGISMRHIVMKVLACSIEVLSEQVTRALRGHRKRLNQTAELCKQRRDANG